MTSLRIMCALIIVSMLSAITPTLMRAAEDQPPMPQPSQEHKLLKKDVGEWDATVKIWGNPDAEPFKSKATETNELLPGGLWLVSRFEGKIGDMRFAGSGIFGYDPIEKKYVGTWVDSMTPHLVTMKGDYDAGTKTMTTIGEGRDAMTGKVMKTKMISRFTDDDARVFEMHMPGEDGEHWKMMEIEYKRKAPIHPDRLKQ